MAENGKEKKNTRARRTPSGEKSGRQQDQVLSGAAEAPKIGKIAGPKKKPAQGDGQRTRGKAEQKKAEPKKTPAKKAEPKKAQEKAPAAGKKKAEGSRRASGKGGRKASAPAISQTAAQVQAIKAQQEAQEKRAARKGRGSRSKKAQKPPIKVYFLGGLNEIGKNFTLYECQGDMVIVDCGLSFPDEDMPGVDSVIPDFAFVEKNRERIRGVVITHGHEDHIGAVPYLMKKLNVPVYGTALTIGLIEGKLKEHNLSSANLHVTPAGSHIQLGCMDVELIHVNHSIADAVALAIHSPAGTIVHTGDFKIDMTPAEGAMIDLCRFAELGKEGVLALLADSTNAERPGYTQTEQTVNNSLDSLFMRAEGKRIIVATFASSISRVQMIINCAVKYGRKVALSGRSMVNVMGIASELGYLHIPDGVLIDLNLINRYEPGQLVLITTGSQGEPMSALTRMAFSDHRQVAINPNDFIIISARPIPGNEKTVGAVVDELLKQDCTVIYESMYDVHVSGHACQEEIKLLHALVKPKYFLPIHGEYSKLWQHAELAEALGTRSENIVIPEIGQVIEMSQDSLAIVGEVPTGGVLVDGLGIGDVGNVVLRDRKHLSQDGLIIVVMAIDRDSGALVSGPDIISRGFVYVRENEDIIECSRELARNIVLSYGQVDGSEWQNMKNRIKDELHRYIFDKIKRNPMILPIIMEI